MAILKKRDYEAKLVRPVDGDTYELFIDEGFGDWTTREIRLRGADTPENGHPLYSAAKNMAGFVLSNRIFIVTTYKRESGTYIKSLSRYIADIFIPADGDKPEIGNLADYLVGMGYALHWDGKGDSPWKTAK